MSVQATTSLINPFSVDVDFALGLIRNAPIHNKRPASTMRGYYADEAALETLIDADDDPLHYETFEHPVPEEAGHLMFCVSRIQAGQIGDECFMTKGHYHTIAGTGELYLGLQGEGLMMMKTAEGACKWEKISKGKMVYVPPFWAHRSINTGTEALAMFCAWPGDAGHNYGEIATEGFPRRVFKQANKWVVK